MHPEPGPGLQPNRLKDLIGRRLPVAKAQGEVFFPSDLETPAATPRQYRFKQPFGLPVRYHDIKVFSEVSNLDLVEIHLSYKDLEVDLDQVLPNRQGIGLVVHAPELFAGDHTLDPLHRRFELSVPLDRRTTAGDRHLQRSEDSIPVPGSSVAGDQCGRLL